MLKRFMDLVIGDIDGKKQYRNMVKRVHLLPREYSSAFKKIQKYMYTTGAPNGDAAVFSDLSIFIGMAELFEDSAAAGKTVADIVGNDVSKFADEFMLAYSTATTETIGAKLNREIMEHFESQKGH